MRCGVKVVVEAPVAAVIILLMEVAVVNMVLRGRDATRRVYRFVCARAHAGAVITTGWKDTPAKEVEYAKALSKDFNFPLVVDCADGLAVITCGLILMIAI